MPLASSIVSVPSVGQLHQSGPGTATSRAPHTSSPLSPWGEASLHTFAQPPTSTATLGLICPHLATLSPTGNSGGGVHRNVGSAGGQHFTSQPTGRFPWPHLAIYPYPSLRPRLREVPSLSSWLYCAYIAVLTPDTHTRELLAYCKLIIREALYHGGMGWQEYDRTFRCQAAIDTSLPWNVLVLDLQAAMLLGNHSGPSDLFCGLCREPDHSTSVCPECYPAASIFFLSHHLFPSS